MSYEVCIASEEDKSWLCRRARVKNTPDLFVLQALDRNGQIKGQIGIELISHSTVEMHVALESPAAIRALLRPAAKIAFGTNRRYVIGRVSGNNLRALRLNKHLGFEEAYRLKDGIEPGVDLVMMLAKRDDCRWLEVANGR